MVSVIVPVYNVEKYLDECVNSVLRLRTPWEMVLVDDGSTDGSGAICDAWAAREERIRVIHQKNGGLSAARNTGIENCGGDYVLFLDSDDFLDPERTDRMLSVLDGSQQILFASYRRFYERENRYEAEESALLQNLQGGVSIDGFLRELPADGVGCNLIACRFAVRRDFLLENGLLFTCGIYHEDEEWAARLLCRAESVYVMNCPFYQYRQAREGSITATVKPKNILDGFVILERMEALSEHLQPDSRKQMFVKRRMAALYLNNMIHLYTLAPEYRQEVLEKLGRFHDGCAQYMTGRIGSLAKLCDRMLGTRATCRLLSIARKIVKH